MLLASLRYVYYSYRAKKEFRKIFIAFSQSGYSYHKNGKVVAKLTNPNQNRVDTARSLSGILPENVSLEDTKEERLDAK